MKKEQVSQLKIEESHGEAFVVDETLSKKEVRKRQKELKQSQKHMMILQKKEQKAERAREKEQAKLENEKKKINYFKKLQIIREETKKRKEIEKQEALEYDKRMSSIYKKQKMPPWLRIDNAGMIYPPARQRHWNFVYRISAITKDEVNVDALSQAIEDILPRFPSFNVCLKKGLFWNYFERAPRKLIPIRDLDFPCSPFDLSDSNANLIRVIYDTNKICFECFHALSDGRGSLTFFNSLLGRYFEILGHEIKDNSMIMSYKDLPVAEELEDSFLKHANNEKTKRPKERAAYKIRGNNLDAGMVNSIVAELSVNELKSIAKAHGCSLTVLLCASIGYVVYKKKKKSKKPVRISVPIDCRTRFESKTLRNFSSYINIDVEGEDLTLGDCIDIFKTNFARIDKNFLLSNINANVNLQKNPIIKIIPRFLKSFIMKNAFNYAGENCQTLAISNIGAVAAPKGFDELIDRYEVNLGRSGHNTKSIGVVSFNDKMTITFSSNIEENETERDFILLLASLGANVKVNSNRRDIYGGI